MKNFIVGGLTFAGLGLLYIFLNTLADGFNDSTISQGLIGLAICFVLGGFIYSFLKSHDSRFNLKLFSGLTLLFLCAAVLFGVLMFTSKDPEPIGQYVFMVGSGMLGGLFLLMTLVVFIYQKYTK
jgi:heme A synthase